MTNLDRIPFFVDDKLDSSFSRTPQRFVSKSQHSTIWNVICKGDDRESNFAKKFWIAKSILVVDSDV